jgi:hypothetical protein
MSETVVCEGAVSGGYDMSIPRFSPIDDDAQVLNEDEYEAG